MALLGLLGLAIEPSRALESPSTPIAILFGRDELREETSFEQVVVASDGQVIVAGEEVGFFWEGNWTFLPQSRTAGIHSLLVDGDTLWVGSSNEIGRLKLPLNSESRYEKIKLPDLNTAGDIWCLARQNGSLIATTRAHVWFINLAQGTAKKIEIPNPSRLFLHRLDGKLIVTNRGSGPWLVADEKLEPMVNPLADNTDRVWFGVVSNFIVGRDVHKKQDGQYHPLLRLTTEGDRYLYTAVSQWGQLLAISTYNKGLILVDPAVAEYSVLAQHSVLASPAVAQTAADQSGRLWVATSRGISLLESLRFGNIRATKEFPLSAFRSGGLLINYDDRSEYWTPQGTPERQSRAFAYVPTTRGPAIGHWGEFSVQGKKISVPGSAVENIVELPDTTLLVTSGERLYHVDLVSGLVELLQEPHIQVSSLAVVGDYVWAATVTGELHRSPVRLPLAFTKFEALPKNAASSLHRFEGTLIVANSESVSFGEPLRAVKHTSGLKTPRLATTADGTVWLLGEQDGHWRLGRLRREGAGVSWETVEAKGLTQLPGVQFLSASGGTLTICGGFNILELEAAELKPLYRLAAPRLQFTFQDPQTGAAATRAETPSRLSADNNSLTFSGSMPFDEFGERPAFERRLLPSEANWVSTKAGESVAYLSLSPRAYTLEVRATHLGRTGPVVQHAFVVLPPWYLSSTAVVGYVLGAGLLSFFIYRWRTHQIRARNLELERIVAERTRELAEASAAKSEFVASMSHEIRNPMNGVIGLVNILREQPALPRQANHLRLLQNCAEQLRATVDDILDFSKIETRRVALQNTTFDLADTLEAAAATVDPAGAAIQFLNQTPAGVSLRGDAAKLRQIFANYLNNALKYGVPPGARVSTILTPVGDLLRLTLSVTSSGPTIEKDKLDEFFESFARGEDAVERNIRGTGLGLAICKRYAEAMGGEVGAVSTNGETTFYLNVPFEKIGALAHVESSAPTPHPTLPARALAIEDEDYNRIVLGDILAKMNYTVDWATTGAEAIHLAQENGYDIILTDYRLPDTNGVELTKKILQLCPVPKPAVFAVTAYSTRERRDECLAAGMAGFISKPITLEKLRSTIAGWGDRQLTTISLETSVRAPTPSKRPAVIDELWRDVKALAATDPKRAADQAHRLNNHCRMHHLIDVAEQLELLEGALERGEPSAQFIAAVERLLQV
jgi:signal transduction histidine kinase/CheY-like chemotaxis protein